MPEMRDRMALQSQHKPEQEPDDHRHGDHSPQDDGIKSLDGETKNAHGN